MTSVSEKMRKAAARRSPNFIRKTEIRSVERGYICPIAKILLKNCFFTQNFTEIGQSAAELGPKTILNMAAVRHLEF